MDFFVAKAGVWMKEHVLRIEAPIPQLDASLEDTRQRKHAPNQIGFVFIFVYKLNVISAINGFRFLH